MRKIIQIGKHSFTSQAKAQAYARTIRDKYQPNETINREDTFFLLQMLELKPETFDNKTAKGVKRITIGYATAKSKCFYIEHPDGTRTDFSFLKIFTQEPPLSKVSKAARYIIRHQIRTFKYIAFDGKERIVCPISGQQVNKEQSHVDHYDPLFSEIVEQFLINEKLKPEDIELEEINGGPETTFKDEALREKFCTLHVNLGNLRIVSASANLKRKDGDWQ